MTNFRKTLLCGVAALAVASPVLAQTSVFRLIRPSISKGGTTSGTTSGGPPAAGTNTTPPGIGTNASDPVLTLSGVGADTTQSANTAINGQFTLTGGVQPVVYSVVKGATPPEVPLGNDGTFAGTTKTFGRYFFVARGTDANGATSDLSVNMKVAPPAPQITVYMPAAPIFVGAHFTAPIAVTNGVAVTSYSFTDMPPEFLSLVGNELRGDPSEIHAGSWTYSVQANDDYDQYGTANGTFDILVPTLTLSGLPGRVRAASPFTASISTNVPDGAWAVASTPAGISGSVAGTTLTASTPSATAETSYGLSVTRTRDDGSSASASQNLVAVPPLAVAGGGPVQARVGRALASVPTPTVSNLLDPTKAATWALGSGTLPSGLGIDPAAGAVSGTPAAGTEGNYAGVAARATDPTDKATATGPAFAVKVAGALAFQGIPGSVTLTRGSAYSASPSFANNVGGGAVTASNLPASLALIQGSATPTLSGSPSANGTNVSRFSVTDPSDGAQGTYDVTFQVVDPITSQTSSTTARKTATVAYSPTLSGQAPYTTSLASGSLPDGLSADPATLRITGTPTTPGTSTATYSVTDARGVTGSVPITVTVTAAPTATAGSPLRFRSGSTRSVASGIATSGFATPAWSKSGSWPAWLAIDANSGNVTGSPTTVTTANVTALVTDAADGANASAPIAVSTVGALVATAQSPVTTREQTTVPASTPAPSASNLLGASSATWAMAGGTLAGGLSVDPAKGTLTGTPASGSAGTYAPTLQATDPVDNASANTAAVSLKVLGPLAFQGIPSTVTLTRGRAYSASPSFANNTAGGPVTASNLPANLALTPNSATPSLSGSPSANGTNVSRFSVTDPADGAQGAYDVTFKVVDPVTASSSSTTARKTSTVSYAPTLSGTAPFTTRLVSGALPDGLAADPATLRITGTPTTVGSSTATYEVTDAQGAVGNVPVSVAVTAPPTASAGAPLAFRINRTRTVPGTVTTSGIATAAWSKSGAWPAWLAIDGATGNVTGSPTTVTTASVTALVTDTTDGANATAPVSVSTVGDLVATAPSAVTTREQVAVPASTPAPSASNLLGSAQATWALGTGALPGGLSVDSAKGILVGSPTAGSAGDYAAALAATDPTDGARASTASYAVKVLGPLTFAGIADNVRVTRGYSYSATPSFTNNAGGGALAASGLPDGITLTQSNGTASLTGAPQTPGTYVANFSVTDPSDGSQATHAVTYAVADALAAARPSVTMRKTQTKAYDPGLNGQGPYTWTLSSGSLPPGLTADPATLVITGSPTTTGNYAATYAVTDANRTQGSVTLNFTVNPAPTLTASKAFPIRVNTTRSTPNEFVTNGIAQAQWSLGTTSDWISIDPATGVITGTPTYTPPSAGQSGWLLNYDPETTGSTTTNVTPGNMYYFTVKVTDLADGAIATYNYMVKAYGTIYASRSAGCQSFLLDSSAGFNNTGGGQCQNSYLNVMSTAPTNDFTNTVFPALGVVTTSGTLPASVTFNKYGQMVVPSGVNFEWAGYFRVTDPIDGQQAQANSGTTDANGNIVYSTLTISSEPTFNTPTYYNTPSGSTNPNIWNGSTLAFTLNPGSVSGGTAPYTYTLYSDATNPAKALSAAPYGSFSASNGSLTGTVSVPAGTTPANFAGHMTISDAAGRTKTYYLGLTGVERTAAVACATFTSGSATKVVYQDPYGIKASNFKVKYTTVTPSGTTPTGTGQFKLSSYPGVDANGNPTGTPTTVSTLNYTSDYNQTVTNLGNTSTTAVSTVWVMEVIPATRAAPAFTASMAVASTAACSPP